MNSIFFTPGWLMLSQIVVTALLWAVKPRDKYRMKLFALSALTFIGLFVALRLLSSHALSTARVDQYLFFADKLFGSPSFAVGRFLQAHGAVQETALDVYRGMYLPVCVLMCVYWTRLPREAYVMSKALVLNFTAALPFYVLCPASGPAFAFKGFPNALPDMVTPHLIHLSSIPNCMPSVHMSTAILVWAFAKRWRAGAVFGWFWMLFTVLSTLGTGQHYFVDLLASAPYTLGVLYASGYEWKRAPQAALVSVCAEAGGAM